MVLNSSRTEFGMVEGQGVPASANQQVAHRRVDSGMWTYGSPTIVAPHLSPSPEQNKFHFHGFDVQYHQIQVR